MPACPRPCPCQCSHSIVQLGLHTQLASPPCREPFATQKSRLLSRGARTRYVRDCTTPRLSWLSDYIHTYIHTSARTPDRGEEVLCLSEPSSFSAGQGEMGWGYERGEGPGRWAVVSSLVPSCLASCPVLDNGSALRADQSPAIPMITNSKIHAAPTG